ncbi:MAG: hypothetical protein KAJ73_00730 [Zetaproteobacteria bacterium]|nr:hypothetical protein [Zetaproteobacteria bacterium]
MHWKNSNFGIRNFIANGCHTPDEAYRMLKQLYEERDLAVRNVKAEQLRTEAKAQRARMVLNNADADRPTLLEAEADLVEIEAFKEHGEMLLADAKRERAYIQSLIDQVQPLRKFAHLPDPEAFQECQEEHWKLELLWRAENFMATQGFIPHDHMATMRLHPAWKAEIHPRLIELEAHFTDKETRHQLEGHAPQLIEHKDP